MEDVGDPLFCSLSYPERKANTGCWYGILPCNLLDHRDLIVLKLCVSFIKYVLFLTSV